MQKLLKNSEMVSILAMYLHIRRFQEYFNHIHILIGSSTLNFLKFWYQNGGNVNLLLLKPLGVI